MKGGTLKIAIPSVMVVIAAFSGAYLFLGGDSGSPKEAIRSTSSYEKLSDDDSFTLKSIKIDSDMIERSRNRDYPYEGKVLDSEDVMEDSYIIGVDFGRFKEERGYFYMAETDTVKAFYQVNSDGELVAEMSGYALSQSYTEKKNN
jgi:hypothetical protein